MNALKDDQNKIIPMEQYQVPEEFGSLVSVLDRVKRVIDEQLVQNVDYGPPFPGAKNLVLYQGGADKLAGEFGLIPQMERIVEDLGNGHRNFEFHCKLYNRNGIYVGDGWGSANTMEDSFAYQFQEIGSVPPAYWDDKSCEPEKRKKHFGNEDYYPKKITRNSKKVWVFGLNKETRPQTQYNNCLKRGQKRAWMDAIYRRTAARNFFSDYSAENDPGQEADKAAPQTVQKDRASRQTTQPAQNTSNQQPAPTHGIKREWTVPEKTFFSRLGIGLKEDPPDLLNRLNSSGMHFGNNAELRIAMVKFLCSISGKTQIDDFKVVNWVEANKEEFLARFCNGDLTPLQSNDDLPF
jgi:hypothetical protein